MNNKIKIPATKKEWAICPNCGSKTVVYDNAATCSGVYIKCTRGCRTVFELNIQDGKQILK